MSQTLSDRARARALAAERPEPPASPGLVKRLFEWVRERVGRLLGRLRPSQAAHHQDRSPGGDVEPARAAAAERAVRDRRQAKKLITAARTAARQWGDVPLATDTVVSVAESISARPGTPAAQRAVLEQVNWETASLVYRATEAAGLRSRCQGEKDAAADRRHQQALSEWSALPRRRRWLTRRPERERPGLPSPEEVAVARGELVGVVRSAMITELEKVVPPADGARTPPVAAAARRYRLPVERPAEGRPQAPVRTPDTWPRTGAAALAPGFTGPGTGTRPLIDPRDDSGGSCPRRRPTAGIAVDRATDPPGAHCRPPETRPVWEHSGGAGGPVRSIHHVTATLAPRPAAPPGRLRPGGQIGKNSARYARFLVCRAVRGNDERHDWAEAHDPRKEE